MKRSCCVVAVAFFLISCSRPKPESAAEGKKETGPIELSLEAQKHVGLQVAPAGVRRLDEYLLVTGTVQPTDNRVATLRPLARGRLLDVLVHIGDRVSSGQTLARYDNIEAGELLAQLGGARAELERLVTQERNLARQADRALSLTDIGAVPKKDYEQARAEHQGALASIKSQESVIAGLVARLQRFGVSSGAVQAPPLTPLVAPLTGVVTKMNASAGEVVEPSSELLTVADLSTVWVQAEVYEKDLGRLRVGQNAFIRVDTYPGEQFTGRVSYISDFLDPQTRTAKVRCEVPNGQMRLKLDMFANVELPTTFSKTTLAVPDGAMQQVGDKTVVFLRKAPTKFEPRWVTAGKTVREFVEITNGLSAGEEVVTTGSFHLKSVLLGKELGEE